MPAFKHYTANVEDCRKDLMGTYECLRSVAKILPLMITYGGNLKTWLRDKEGQIKSRFDLKSNHILRANFNASYMRS